MSGTSEPTFNEEILFLKVLVEGKACLYEYTDGVLTRYFYNIANSHIKQLTYKRYIGKVNNLISPIVNGNSNAVRENNEFRRQLWVDLKCPRIEIPKIIRVNYKKNDLVKIFIEYSDCQNQKSIVYKEQKGKKDLFNLNFRSRLNNSSLTVKNSFETSKDTDFGNKTAWGMGLEAEFIFPFNRNKWSVAIEPTYQYYKGEITSDTDTPYDGKLTRKANLSFIEIPLSLRHYLFLNKNSKLFLDASFVINSDLNSSIKYTINDIPMEPVHLSLRHNAAIGIGYKQNDKYSLAIRYQTRREIIGFIGWHSDYKTMSVIFGYTIF